MSVQQTLQSNKSSELIRSFKKCGSSGHKAYVIKHDMGENWSLYHETIMEAIFSYILHKPIQVNMTSNLLFQIS